MPTNLVHNKRDEKDWNEAKRAVRGTKPRKRKNGKWPLVTYIYERIKRARRRKKKMASYLPFIDPRKGY